MRRSSGWAALLVVAAVLPLAGCGTGGGKADTEEPAKLEQVGDTTRIVLTERAAQRLGLRTAAVRQGTLFYFEETVVPYSALLYSLTGETSVYVSTGPLTFVRKKVVVDHIDGGDAILSAGPPVGARVATVGVSELYGTESGVGGGH
jgi:hypothetical protein